MSQLGPEIATPVPGPRSRELAKRLSQVESRNVTCLTPDVPIFWQRAVGVNVWDADGNRYVDLGGAFGVANAGHSHPEVATAIAGQAGELLHGMGDVHPSALKVELLEALCARFPGGGEARAVPVSSGSDAVEAALKTSMLATGRAGVIAFEGGYHGLSLGALDTTWRSDFRAPFESRLANATGFARYGDAEDVGRAQLELAARGVETGAVIVEPVQGRGGERIPPTGFLRALRECCDAEGWLLIADEIYTGFGRTGRWFACEHEGVVPDLLCVGKGLSSGMPLAACIGRAPVMDAWPISSGEALHTQTFLAHPTSCAAALASLRVLEREQLISRSARVGALALDHARSVLGGARSIVDVRGLGLMLGIECHTSEVALEACANALARGYILLPSGDDGRVLSLTPPLSIDEALLLGAIDVLADLLS
jgi:4-aminobutyrate aminotransferase/(S)-3-amino-2-methylpropionate transaminase